MNREVVLNSKSKRQKDLAETKNKKWDHDDNFILAVWDKYCEGKMSARRVMETFPGRTFKAIESKVYRIRGRSEKPKGDPNQLSLPLGGQLN